MKDAYSFALGQLLRGRNLTRMQSDRLFEAIFTGNVPEQTIKSILLLLAQKGESEAEILGCLKAIRKYEPAVKTRWETLMDNCGTGGDGSQSFNVSTLAAIVIAGAGGKVAKHGNRAISSKCGSSDLMEALGVNLNASKKRMLKSIDRYGLGYFHAPAHHPVFSKMQPLRRSLKIRTIFNWLGPLLNPLELKSQMVGIANPAWLRPYSSLVKNSGVSQAFVYHSQDGLDEFSTQHKTKVAQIRKNRIRWHSFNPSQCGFARVSRRAFRGGNARTNARIATALLKGKRKGPLREMVLLNAAQGLLIAGISPNLKEAIIKAARSLDSGAAWNALAGLKRISNLP